MRTYGFLVGVEIEGDNPNLEAITLKLADACTFVDGVATIDVESLGEVDVYDGPEQRTGEAVV